MVQRRHARRAVHGVLLLDKPSGLSSNHALQQARRLLNAAKAGHTGTLDPLASGLLPLTFGEATKFSQQLLDADKTYRAVARLGQTTTTGDAEGEILRRRPVAADAAALERALTGFRGDIEQVPPMHSALKHQGRPLYELAREGVEIARPPRAVRIHRLEAIGLDGERFEFEVCCSKGTYVRTLAEDIGEVLGCGAHLTALCRTAIGPLSLRQAATLERLAQLEEAARDQLLAPMDSLLGHLPRRLLDAQQAGVVLHGGSIEADLPAGTEASLYSPSGFIGLGRVDAAGRLWPKRLVAAQYLPAIEGSY